MNLTYRAHALIEDLQPGECTVHRAGLATGARWWNLWFYVARETDGVLEDYVVPINPGGGYVENGPGGRTWGLTKTAAGIWQVSPSIDVKQDSRDSHPGTSSPQGRSAWHQTPAIVGVPDGEPWQSGAP